MLLNTSTFGATCDPLAYATLDAIKQLAAAAEPKSLAEATLTAAGCGQIAALRELLGDKGDPTKAFHRAASDGAIESMQFLLDRGLNLQAAGGDALLKAAYKGQTQAMAFSTQGWRQTESWEARQAIGTTDHGECRRGAVVGAPPGPGADPNSLTDEEYDKGSTPLFSVCASDNEEIGRSGSRCAVGHWAKKASRPSSTPLIRMRHDAWRSSHGPGGGYQSGESGLGNAVSCSLPCFSAVKT